MTWPPGADTPAAPARTGTRKRGNSNGGGVKRSDLSAVREWARQNGHTVSERGRISSEIQQAYDNAH